MTAMIRKYMYHIRLVYKKIASKLLQSINTGEFGMLFHSVIYAIKLHVKYNNKEYF